jgi:hypothetical protein
MITDTFCESKFKCQKNHKIAKFSWSSKTTAIQYGAIMIVVVISLVSVAQPFTTSTIDKDHVVRFVWDQGQR